MAGDRSPNYPIISLADAVGRVQLVYEKERQHAADKIVVAKALGYGSLNGLSRSIISALVKFGLLTESGDQLRVSLEALDILLRSPGQPERGAAIQRAAYAPPLFSELRAVFDGSLPSDENMRAFLVKKGFNPNTVSNVIRSYRDTVLFANQEAAPVAKEEAIAAPEPAAPVPSKVPGAITMFAPSQGAQAPEREHMQLAFNLSANCHAAITLTGEVTQEALAKLKAYLDLSMDTFPAARAAARDAEAAEAEELAEEAIPQG